MKKYILYALLTLSPCTSLMATAPVSKGQELIDAINIINSAKRKATADEIKAVKKLIKECSEEEIKFQGSVVGKISFNGKSVYLTVANGTALMGVVAMGNIEIVELMLKTGGININLVGSLRHSVMGEIATGVTALSIAIEKAAKVEGTDRDKEIVKLFLGAKGININIPVKFGDREGSILTHLIDNASINLNDNEEEIIKLLLEKKEIDLTIKNEDQKTALYIVKDKIEVAKTDKKAENKWREIELLIETTIKRQEGGESTNYALIVSLAILATTFVTFGIIKMMQKAKKDKKPKKSTKERLTGS